MGFRPANGQHQRACARRLPPDGDGCQWLPGEFSGIAHSRRFAQRFREYGCSQLRRPQQRLGGGDHSGRFHLPVERAGCRQQPEQPRAGQLLGDGEQCRGLCGRTKFCSALCSGHSVAGGFHAGLSQRSGGYCNGYGYGRRGRIYLPVEQCTNGRFHLQPATRRIHRDGYGCQRLHAVGSSDCGRRALPQPDRRSGYAARLFGATHRYGSRIGSGRHGHDYLLVERSGRADYGCGRRPSARRLHRDRHR